jgi:hypothetical protein
VRAGRSWGKGFGLVGAQVCFPHGWFLCGCECLWLQLCNACSSVVGRGAFLRVRGEWTEGVP